MLAGHSSLKNYELQSCLVLWAIVLNCYSLFTFPRVLSRFSPALANASVDRSIHRITEDKVQADSTRARKGRPAGLCREVTRAQKQCRCLLKAVPPASWRAHHCVVSRVSMGGGRPLLQGQNFQKCLESQSFGRHYNHPNIPLSFARS